MAGETQDTNWPLPKFYFKVTITDVGENLPFQEVSGLDVETQPIEYRAGNSKDFSPVKMPGLRKVGNLTLKKGVFQGDNKFADWHTKIVMNTIKRATVTVSLCNEKGDPTMTWQLDNAWPTKITGTDLKADGNEVAVETLEIAYEKLTITNKAS